MNVKAVLKIYCRGGKDMKLYEIDNAILECIDLETGEIIDTDKLNELQMERDTKIENVACWIKDLKAEAEAIKKEKQALNERQKVAENKAESLKKWLAYVLNGEKFKTAKCAVSFRNTESVEVTDEGIENLMKEHDDLLTYKNPEPNKTAIKAAIKAGLSVHGVQLVQNVSTIIK